MRLLILFLMALACFGQPTRFNPFTGKVDFVGIGGASSVAATQVLYGTGAGVAGSESAFVYDAAADVLAIRRSPSNSVTANADIPARAALITRGSSGVGGNPTIALFSTTNGSAIASFFESTFNGSPLSLQPFAGNLLLGTTTDDGTNRLQVAGGVRVTGVGSLLSRVELGDGSTASSPQLRFRDSTWAMNIGTASSLLTFSNGDSVSLLTLSSGGTLTLNSATPTTGVTQMIVRAGAGQGSTALMQLQNGAGGANFQVISGGEMSADNGAGNYVLNPSTGLRLPSSFLVRFASTTNGGGGVLDASLSRSVANVIQVGDGAANANGTLAARAILGTAVTFANLGTPTNGTFLFCSDCTIASPCASGGTGALAKRLNSTWVCN